MVSSTSRRPFEFVANHIVLDFINTVNARPRFTRDDLTCAADVVAWAAAADIVERRQQATRDAATSSQFDAAISLRENLYRVFGAIADGRPPPRHAVAAITSRAADALRSAQWRRGDKGYAPSWSPDSIESLCDLLADQALVLLRSPAVGLVGSCDGCGWLFLDVSRAHARRWCSMSACGARHKMRRYHNRQSAAGTVER